MTTSKSLGTSTFKKGLALLAGAFFLATSLPVMAGHVGGPADDEDGPLRINIATKNPNSQIVPMAGAANLKYYGGRVISNVKVYSVNWGPNVSSTVTNGMAGFYTAVTNSAYFDWLSEYNTVGKNGQDGQPGSNQTIGRGTFGAQITITPTHGSSTAVSDANIQAELASQITAGVLPAPVLDAGGNVNSIYMFNFPSAITVTGSDGSKSCVQFCAYHGTAVIGGRSVPYGVLPDLSGACSTGCGGSTIFNNTTSVASHELIEAVTDMEVGIGTTVARPLAWYDSTAGNGEIGDICNAQQATVAGYTVQKEWSNVNGACIATGPTATNDFSMAVAPATRTIAAGSSTTFSVTTSVISGVAESLSLSVTGLAAGVTASFSPTTVTAGGSSTLTLTAAGGAAASSATFTVRATGASASHTAAGSLTVTVVGGLFPESAHPYTNNFDNTWTYTLTGSPASINVTFDPQTQVETNFDKIYVMDKNGVNITGSPFTGTTLAGATKNVVGDTVKIRLTSDVSVVFYGFKVTNVVAASGGGDVTPPTTSVTAPANGATVSGTTNITATANDAVGVVKIEVYVDGALKGSNTAATSFTYAWNTTTVANGAHTITSKAYDAANNVGTSSTVNVTVNNIITGQQLIVNPGFETGTASPWVMTAGVLDNGTGEAAHAGSWKAWMNGYAAVHTDSVMQQVTIPASATSATLTFWLHIDTAETGTSAFDTLNVQVRNSSGAVLSTLATYSNANAAAGFVQKSFNLIAYKGQTIQINLVGVEDASLQTSFVVDDFALNVQ